MINIKYKTNNFLPKVLFVVVVVFSTFLLFRSVSAYNEPTTGCIAADGKYACSPTSKTDCSDVPNAACTGRTCLHLAGNNLCGLVANPGSVAQSYACVAANGKYACSPPSRTDCSEAPNNSCAGKTCFQIPTILCGATASAGTPTPGSGGTGTTKDFSLQPYGPKSFTDLLNVIITWIFNIAIPVAVIMIIWAGLTMLTAGGNPSKFEKGKKMLGYAVAGLAIIFIGKGFISLIKSILELGQ